VSVHAKRSENWSGRKEQQNALIRPCDQLKGTTNKAEESNAQKMEREGDMTEERWRLLL
jgi:hypothetical protein